MFPGLGDGDEEEEDVVGEEVDEEIPSGEDDDDDDDDDGDKESDAKDGETLKKSLLKFNEFLLFGACPLTLGTRAKRRVKAKPIIRTVVTGPAPLVIFGLKSFAFQSRECLPVDRRQVNEAFEKLMFAEGCGGE